MQPCPKEPPAMVTYQMHRVVNMLRENERDDQPQKDHAQEANPPAMCEQIFHHNERDQRGENRLHIFLIFR